MPTRTPARKKMVKKTVKKAMKTVMRAKAKTKATVARKKVAAKVAKVKITGKVIHFYDRISVAIVELARPMKVGDKVLFKHGDQEVEQKIASMQINHAPVKSAKKKQVVGVKVDVPVKDGSMVMPA